MKNIFKFLLGIFFLFSMLNCGGGSSDDDVDQKYYFKAKLNGTEIDFLHSAKLQGGGNDNRFEHITLSGYDKKLPNSSNLNDVPPAFGIEIWNMGGNIGSGTYSQAGNPTDNNTPASYSLSGEYHPTPFIQYDAKVTQDFVFTITELSKTDGIKGTFKGKLISSQEPGKVIEVTEGELYLPYDIMVP